MLLVHFSCPNRIFCLAEYSDVISNARNEMTNSKSYFWMSEAKLETLKVVTSSYEKTYKMVLMS